MRCELISWAEVHRLCRQLARMVRASGYRPDIVVAIGRGGLVPARLVCDCLDIMALTSIKIDHYNAGSSKQAQAVIRFPLCTDIGEQRVLLCTRQLLDGVDLLCDLPADGKNLLANRGNGHRATGALENGNTQFFLELPDLSTEGWLAHVAAFRRLAEMPCLGHGNDVLNVSEVHALK
jgi:hypothetical protein